MDLTVTHDNLTIPHLKNFHQEIYKIISKKLEENLKRIIQDIAVDYDLHYDSLYEKYLKPIQTINKQNHNNNFI
jgi:hypothetical protein